MQRVSFFSRIFKHPRVELILRAQTIRCILRRTLDGNRSSLYCRSLSWTLSLRSFSEDSNRCEARVIGGCDLRYTSRKKETGKVVNKFGKVTLEIKENESMELWKFMNGNCDRNTILSARNGA
ncbi:PREDICTED: uncharacterized protein LOC105147046 [Acromyrmex echinatior]|uniref:uncharacterized protein LOC105147046 n=1 Tax=Acromyrmex echinatior TaxID=103372 RepID=UPI000580BDB4|nr:PREDICTED: uncharacterized protein LOC105147046 [Acromyrmex echinatior]